MQTKFSVIGLQLPSTMYLSGKAGQALPGEVYGCRQ